jgi:serine-type D-Ala-D-Ala carboxypeptidase (penicillin-binding protein 5/6)
LGLVKVRLLAVAAVLALAAPAAAAPPPIAARAALVQNGSTGEVLFRYRARARVPIASITKLMTVLVALERARPGELMTVPAEATAIGGSTADLRPGEQITVRDLLEAALVESANDAAYTLAVNAGGGSVEAFVGLMNRRARTLGLSDTHFVRPDGLDAPGHVSSARDVTRLARVAMQKPAVREIVRLQSATIAGGRVLHTWNDLLATFPGVIGVKTGHTSGAGWSEVAAARGPGFTIYGTLLGSSSRSERNADLAELLSWGLAQYRVAPVVAAGRAYARVATEFGRGPLRLVAERPLKRAIRVGRPLVERVVAPAFVALPVARGQPLGEVRLFAGRREIGRRRLVAGESISRPGFAGRVGWYAGRTLDHVSGWLT